MTSLNADHSPMAYLSLYRKYRSQSFEEVSGQDHVTRTLQNAIRTGRVAHAYLFCGPRGTGKTSTARLLAKALNCQGATEPTPEPCNGCGACTQITAGSFLDLREIDAASNRGIDEMRDLRDNVAYTPAEGRFKVYVIDEAHQLTMEAFNALLKTLEEPPAHVVFILATTEAHKIPATIISRCQRFEFRRASVEQLRERVRFVAESEGAGIDPGALDLIARDANGGWRDALSLLEQVLAFSDGTVTAKDVYTVLGTVEAGTLHDLAAHIHAGDGAQVWRLLEELIASGKDPRQLLRDLTAHFRALMLTGSGCPPAASAEDTARLTAQAREFGLSRLIAAIELLAQTEREARWSEQPRLLVELAVARLMQPPRTGRLEVEPDSAPRPEPRPAARAAVTAPRSAPAAASPPPPAAVPAAAPAAPPFVEEPQSARPAESGTAAAAGFGGAPLPPPPLTVGDARTGGREDEDDLDLFGAPPPPPDELPDVPPASRPMPASRTASPAPPPAPRSEPAPAAPVSTPAAPASGTPDLEVLRRKWRLVGEQLKRTNKKNIEACLVDTQPDRFEGDTLVLLFPNRTMADLFTTRGKNFSDPLAQAIQQVTGMECRVRAEYGGGNGGGTGTGGGKAGAKTAPAPGRAAEREAGTPAAARKSDPLPARPPAPPPTPGGTGGDELVHDVLEVFDGRIVDGRDVREGP